MTLDFSIKWGNEKSPVFFCSVFQYGNDYKMRIVDVFPKCDVTAQISTSVFFFFYGPASCMHWEEQLNLYGCLVRTNTKRCVTPLCTNGAQVNDNRRPCDSRVRHFEYLAGLVKAVMFKIHEWRMRKKSFATELRAGEKEKYRVIFRW